MKYFTALQCRRPFIAIYVLLFIFYKLILIADIVVNFNQTLAPPTYAYVCIFVYFTGNLKHLPKFIFIILIVTNITVWFIINTIVVMFIPFGHLKLDTAILYCLQRLQNIMAYVERLDGFDKCISLSDVEDVEKGLSSLEFNKAGGIDGLTKECISYCHPAVLVHLKSLFNTICLHGFVPDSK